MCLITLAWQAHPDYPLALAANRDEFFARPTSPADHWDNAPGLIAGRDEQAGGTWLGIRSMDTRSGRWAALTNVRRLPAPERQGPSRGQLVLTALQDTAPLAEVMETLAADVDQYDGFNLLAGDHEGLYYLSNYRSEVQRLNPGVYALSNGTLDEPWPKVIAARENMDAFLVRPGPVSELAHLLVDPTQAPTAELPDTGLSTERERALSSQFIELPDYGTRACTGLIMDATGTARFHEQTFGPGRDPQTERAFTVEGFWPDRYHNG